MNGIFSTQALSSKSVTLAKHDGGLNIPSMKERNQAFLANFVWRSEHSPGIWAKILKFKFVNPGRKPLLKGSPNWIPLVNGKTILDKGIEWTIGGGKQY